MCGLRVWLRAGKTAVDFFGAQLEASGYNYHGSEPIYSGLQGTVMRADIYIGVVYYQRLRHMVSDKSQVRSTGPIDSLTRQPIKGRKRHGGIRLGEMERDSLLAHGTAFLMQARVTLIKTNTKTHACKQVATRLVNRHAAQLEMAAQLVISYATLCSPTRSTLCAALKRIALVKSELKHW